jgi:hypothetical protein
MGCGLVITFIDHLRTQLRTASTYSATADLHNSLITTAPLSLFQPATFLPAVFWQRLLAVEILSFTLSGSFFTTSRAQLFLN